MLLLTHLILLLMGVSGPSFFCSEWWRWVSFGVECGHHMIALLRFCAPTHDPWHLDRIVDQDYIKIKLQGIEQGNESKRKSKDNSWRWRVRWSISLFNVLQKKWLHVCLLSLKLSYFEGNHLSKWTTLFGEEKNQKNWVLTQVFLST